jgi:hypothetical protein
MFSTDSRRESKMGRPGRERKTNDAEKRRTNKVDKQCAIIEQVQAQTEADKKKYRSLLYKPYYHGLIDGEKRIIRLLEAAVAPPGQYMNDEE